MDIFLDHRGRIQFDSFIGHASVGKRGVGHKKREGDHITPLGNYPLRKVLFRPDRVMLPNTKLPSQEIQPDDGWCNETDHLNYNMLVKLPFNGTHEIMWRNDHVYDILVIIGYNDNPIISGQGSAIFIHLAHFDFRPTEGCVGVSIETMKKILNFATLKSRVIIQKNYTH